MDLATRQTFNVRMTDVGIGGCFVDMALGKNRGLRLNLSIARRVRRPSHQEPDPVGRKLRASKLMQRTSTPISLVPITSDPLVLFPAV